MNASKSAGAMRRRPHTKLERNAPVSIARSNDRLETPAANCASSIVSAIFAGQLVVSDILGTFLSFASAGATTAAQRRDCA
jgi:hypothetical protein